MDAFVDTLARRLASFDRRPIEAATNLVNQVSLPTVDRLFDGRNAFAASIAWPETRRRVAALFEREMQREGDLEDRCGAHLPSLLDGDGD
ncbi:hypothetical protein ACFYXS_04495 [Streptomyces sp. NPDC002574]|uniref:hypothetical protein n=1 Tax=Streptomyces sp. NPDC002574 TaxID=3364652 RepID=UPI0036A47B34